MGTYIDGTLDLEGRLRPGLDILTTEIILSLKKRQRYHQNLPIYAPGLVIGRPDVTLLRNEMEKMERFHAELGRYTFASQQAFTDVSDVNMIIKRSAPKSPIRPFRNQVGDKVIEKYQGWIATYCPEGDDSNEYGETVTADVYGLLNIYQRINMGMFVAESKFQGDTKGYIATEGDADAIWQLLVNQEREAQVIDRAARLAEYYEFHPEQAREVFRWMIDLTVEVEIRYLKMCIEQEQGA